MTDENQPTEQTTTKNIKTVKSRGEIPSPILFIELGLLIIIIIAVVSGIFLWHVHRSPLDITFAKPTIQSALANQNTGMHAEMDRILLHWPDLAGPLLLALDKVKVLDKNNQAIVAFDHAALGLSIPRLMVGQIKPSALIIHDIALSLHRDQDGVNVGFNLTGPAAPVKPEQTDLSAKILSFMGDPEHADPSSPLSHLKQFSIQNALLSIDDRLLNMRWTVADAYIDIEHINGGLDSTFSATLRDPVDSRVRMEGSLQHMRSSEDFLTGHVDITANEITQAEIAAIIPDSLKDEAAAEWIGEKLSKGTFKDLQLNADIRLDDKLNVETPQLNGQFSFEHMDIAYLQRLSPITNASGTGQFSSDIDRLTITTKTGDLRGITIKDSTVQLDHVLEEGKDTADVNITMEGPLAQVMGFIAEERIGANHGFDIDKVKGAAALDVHLHFPTLTDVKADDVDISITGTVKNGALPDVTHGFDLTDGAFDITLKDHLVEVTGQGTFAERPAQINYSQYIKSAGKPFKSKITASLKGDTLLAKKMGVDIAEYIQGSFPLDLTYTTPVGDTTQRTIDIDADITPSVLTFSPFSYTKTAGENGRVRLQAQLNNGTLNTLNNMVIETQDAHIKDGKIEFSNDKLKRATFPALKIKDTQGKATIERTKAGVLNIDISGPFFDARPFLKSEGKNQDRSAMSLKVKSDKMRTSDEETISKADLFALMDQTGRFNRLDFGAIAGNGPVRLKYGPQDDAGHIFTLDAQDAGAALRAFGLYSKMKGGKLTIRSTPKTAGDTVNGTVEITDFSLVKAPVLARLLGTLSLPGLLNTLNGDGVSFSKLSAGYGWTYRPNGSLITLKEGRTSGNAMGLTFDGQVDLNTKTINVSGTVIPLSDINKLISDIPLVGNLITGGSDSLFAATYTLKGPTNDPQVSVNPLSVLAPGIVRRVLFE